MNGIDLSSSSDPTPSEKLTRLRTLLQTHNLDAYLVFSEDCHFSEYVAPCDERRSYLSNFTGSAGLALVTCDDSVTLNGDALLWTDGRYFQQANKQLCPLNWTLMKQFEPNVPSVEEYIEKNLQGKRIGLDPFTVSNAQISSWRFKFALSSSPPILVPIQKNLIDEMWEIRPSIPQKPVCVHPTSLAGEEVSSKVSRVRESLVQEHGHATVISALDQIAWLYNLRGSDIDCNPVFFGYGVVTLTGAHLFLGRRDENDEELLWLSEEVKNHLVEANVTLHSYGTFVSQLPTILQTAGGNGAAHAEVVCLVEKSTCSMAIADTINKSSTETITVVRKEFHTWSPVELFKSIKNQSEIDGIRSAALQDSVALIRYLAYLSSQHAINAELKELDVCEILTNYRNQQTGYKGDSFGTISSSGPNASVIHYTPQPDTQRTLNKHELYLCDSGAHYTNGTTDVTRTLYFGDDQNSKPPSAEIKRCYTRVLQGYFALYKAIIPDGTPGLILETYARSPLWRDGLVYGHGTGHGIGCCLNVHEGPQSIGSGNLPGNIIRESPKRLAMCLEPIRAGMYISNEPGYYKDGEFGMRIESDLIVHPVRHDAFHECGDTTTVRQSFLEFECVTKVPMCRTLIDLDLLNNEERRWVDEYHREVQEAILPLLDHDDCAKRWLMTETAPL